MSDFKKPIRECDPKDVLHSKEMNRQYHCSECNTVTIIRGETRYCQCYKGRPSSPEAWKEVFLD